MYNKYVMRVQLTDYEVLHKTVSLLLLFISDNNY